MSQLQEILNGIKRNSFVDGYEATDAEAFGMLLSRHFEWDGTEVLKAAAFGLEDANFHTECAILMRMAERGEQGLPCVPEAGE